MVCTDGGSFLVQQRHVKSTRWPWIFDSYCQVDIGLQYELAGHLDNYVPEPELPSGTSPQDRFDAEVSMPGGGEPTKDTQAVEFSFRYGYSPVAGSIQLMDRGQDKSPEEKRRVELKLDKSIMLQEGLHFYWQVGWEVRGYGRVSKIKR
jgi:hypothetical protein